MKFFTANSFSRCYGKVDELFVVNVSIFQHCCLLRKDLHTRRADSIVYVEPVQSSKSKTSDPVFILYTFFSLHIFPLIEIPRFLHDVFDAVVLYLLHVFSCDNYFLTVLHAIAWFFFGLSDVWSGCVAVKLKRRKSQKSTHQMFCLITLQYNKSFSKYFCNQKQCV